MRFIVPAVRLFARPVFSTQEYSDREIESQLGRKFVSLTIPKPACYNDPDKQPTINVRISLSKEYPRKLKCSYDGSQENWFYDWFGIGKGDKKPADG